MITRDSKEDDTTNPYRLTAHIHTHNKYFSRTVKTGAMSFKDADADADQRRC